MRLLLILLILFNCLQIVHSEESYNILLLNSYHKGYKWTDEVTRGVEETFADRNISLYIEYLDSKRFFNPEYLEALSVLLKKKHRSNPYDLVITSDNNAFDFYRERGAGIFDEIPVVFCGLNYLKEADLKGLSNVTGINERADIEKNLELIESIHSDIDRILIISDNTTTGAKIRDEIENLKDKRSPDKPGLDLVYDISAAELKERLEQLDDKYIVYLTVFSRDRLGEFFEFDRSTEFISRSSSVPVYGTWNFQLGHGIVGGYLVEGYSQGQNAAFMALDILSGMTADLIPVDYNTQVSLNFDFKEMEKSGIRQRDIPPESVVINHTELFFYRYKLQILVVTLLFILLLSAFLGVAYGLFKTRKAERRIRFSEESLRATLYSIGDGVISTDLNQKIVRMNPVAELLTGWNNSEAQGCDISKVFRINHVISGEPMKNPIGEALASGRIIGLPRHTSLTARDGREFKIADSAAPIQDDSGQITGAVLVFRNITEEYRIQEELLKEKDYAARIINNAPGLICGLDEEGTSTFINPVFEKITGYSSEEIIGRNFWKLFYPDEEFSQVRKLLNDSRDGVVVDYEMVLTCKNGDKKNIVWNSFARKNNNNEITGYLGFGFDITVQKTIKEALTISKKRLRTIIDLVPSSIFVKNREGVFLALNKPTADGMGLGIKEIVGKKLEEVYPYPELVKNMLEQDRIVFENGKPIQVAEENYAGKTGELLWQKTVKIPCPENLFGEPAVLGVSTDITDIKKAEQRLYETNKELVNHKNNLEELVAGRTLELQISLDHLQETQKKLVESEKMAALGGLVAGVAHEVNTPVGIGVTAASHLEESIHDFEKLYETDRVSRKDFEKFLELCAKSSKMLLSNMNRAAELIQSFKQVAVDQSSQERRVFLIHEYIDEVLLSLNATMKKTPYKIQVNCPEELEIDSYPGALSQIITNLVMNSLKHGFEGQDEGTITIDVRKSESNVLIIFGDTGCGIPEEYLDKIFEPFFTTKRGAGGSGLGMNIVYNLVTQSLQGQISCSSEVGRGTWFEIEFPSHIEYKKGSP